MEFQPVIKNNDFTFTTRELSKFRGFISSCEFISLLKGISCITLQKNNSTTTVTWILFGNRPVFSPVQRNKIRSVLKLFSNQCEIKIVQLPISFSQEIGSFSNYKREASLFKESTVQFNIIFKQDNISFSQEINHSAMNQTVVSIVEKLNSIVFSENSKIEFKPISFISSSLGAAKLNNYKIINNFGDTKSILLQYPLNRFGYTLSSLLMRQQINILTLISSSIFSATSNSSKKE